ncbi:hypothetical protein EGW08_013150 [Elysia chlorotica]|uniref:MYND-type domain-containing protein n=1 Tax=Elysia chlorotica TaxID=188477 RepID=A0A3S1HGV4_ELYCH|nr:hypothetical protein EGW08_013150 [Elysia chlorotica]
MLETERQASMNSNRQNETTEEEQEKEEEEEEEDDNESNRDQEKKNVWKKKNSKSKSKKKSKRGHGKRNKTKQNAEGYSGKGNAASAPSTSTQSTNNCRPSPQAGSSSSTQNCVRDAAPFENAASRMDAVQAGLGAYHYWQQFSTSASQCDQGETTSNLDETCVKCGAKGRNSILCTMCRVARYCCKSCEKKDARRHRPTCVRIFTFNAASKSVQPYLTLRHKLAVSQRVKIPPVSYFMGSIPDQTRFKILPFHPPVLLEIQRVGFTEEMEWVVNVMDVANNTTTVVINVMEKDFLQALGDNVKLEQTLIPGNFIIILIAHWTVGSRPENCMILYGKDSS